FEELQAPTLIERVFGLSLLWLAAVWSITFNGVQPAAARTAFPRLPDGRDVTALVPGCDRLADCLVVTKSWHSALRRSARLCQLRARVSLMLPKFGSCFGSSLDPA